MLDLTNAVTSALIARGLKERRARLASQAAMAAFVYAAAAWSAGSKKRLETYLEQAFNELRAVSTE
jgi:hypothetical protein